MIIVKMKCIIVLILFAVSCNFNGVSANGGVFQVQHRFAGVKRSLTDIKDHDTRRHQRLLYSIDVPLGGDGKATGTGLYFTKIKIGSPSRDYYVHVDTGSDLFWVNCAQCNGCPSKSGLGIDLTLYNPESSSGSERITCDQEFCTLNSGGPIPGCYRGAQCQYQLGYGDGSSTLGYFVKDVVQYDRVSGNLATTSANSCGTQQSGNLQDPSVALDGLIGFGQSKISMLSQIAATGAIKQKFAHCLDGVHRGGIFAIGNVVQPSVKTTPMVPNKQHYNVNLLSIMVGKSTLSLPSGVLGTANPKETIVDSGTTLAYLPDVMYQALISQSLGMCKEMWLVPHCLGCSQLTNMFWINPNSSHLYIYDFDFGRTTDLYIETLNMWGEALLTSNYILNKIPHKITGKTPYVSLVKSLYGLKQAPKQWHEKFDNVMMSNGFTINECDKCIYVLGIKLTQILRLG
ncbi:hypothetical protein ACHQM5_002336 [Ranunculus cassubicifolius]